MKKEKCRGLDEDVFPAFLFIKTSTGGKFAGDVRSLNRVTTCSNATVNGNLLVPKTEGK